MSELPVEEREALQETIVAAWKIARGDLARTDPMDMAGQGFEAGYRAALAAREEVDGDPSHTRQTQYDAIVKLQDELGVARSRLAAREIEKLPPHDVDWARVRRCLDEAVAMVAPPDVKKIKLVVSTLEGWAWNNDELTREQADFVERIAKDLRAAIKHDDVEKLSADDQALLKGRKHQSTETIGDRMQNAPDHSEILAKALDQFFRPYGGPDYVRVGRLREAVEPTLQALGYPKEET